MRFTLLTAFCLYIGWHSDRFVPETTSFSVNSCGLLDTKLRLCVLSTCLLCFVLRQLNRGKSLRQLSRSFILFGILRLSRNERGHHLLAQPARTWARCLTPTDNFGFPTFYSGKKNIGFSWKTDYHYKLPSR